MSDITAMLSLSSLPSLSTLPGLRALRAWRQRPSRPSHPSHLGAPSTLGSSRIEVCPPSLRQAPDTLGERIVFWLTAPAPLDAAPPASRLPAVRADFLSCLDELLGTPGLAPSQADQADALHGRIARAHSLRELWHLRTELHRLLALALGERVAGERVAALNGHFPTRAARASAFAPL